MSYAAMGATMKSAREAPTRETHLTLRAGESPSRRYIRWLGEQGITSRDAKAYVTHCVLSGGGTRTNPEHVQACIDKYKAAMAPTMPAEEEYAAMMPSEEDFAAEAAALEEPVGIPKWAIGLGIGTVVLGGLLLLRKKPAAA